MACFCAVYVDAHGTVREDNDDVSYAYGLVDSFV